MSFKWEAKDLAFWTVLIALVALWGLKQVGVIHGF